MTENDLLRASPSKLSELARFYGLRQAGERSIWIARKSATHPLTHKQHFFKFSTQTADLRTALLRAVPKVEEFLASVQTHLEAPVRSSSGRLALTDLEKAYLAAPTVRASAAVRKRNWADLERILRLVHPDVDVRIADVGLINRELAKEYQRRRLAQIEADAKGNKLTIEAGKRALNSTLAHAQSIFSRAALEDYHTLRLPAGVHDFRAALPVKARRQEPPQQISDAVIAAVRAAVDELRATAPATWAAFQLMLWGGLRNVDAYHARHSWLVREENVFRLMLVPTADYTPKATSGDVVLPLEIGEALLALPQPEQKIVSLADGQKPDPYLVPAEHATARHEACYRAVGALLKAHGVTAEHGKVAYRLRKYFLAKVDAQQGRAVAEAAARHAPSAHPGSVSVLEAHYVGPTKMQKPIAL